MDIFRLNWFLGVLAIELWASAVLLAWGPDLRAIWRRRLAKRHAPARRHRPQFGRLA